MLRRADVFRSKRAVIAPALVVGEDDENVRLGRERRLAEMVHEGANQITAMLNHSSQVEEARLILIVFGCSTKCDLGRAAWL